MSRNKNSSAGLSLTASCDFRCGFCLWLGIWAALNQGEIGINWRGDPACSLSGLLVKQRTAESVVVCVLTTDAPNAGHLRICIQTASLIAVVSTGVLHLYRCFLPL